MTQRLALLERARAALAFYRKDMEKATPGVR